MLIRKSFEDVQQTAIKAEEPDLAAIRKYALREVTAEEIWTGSMKLCHDRVDRTFERFPKAYLERFAATLPGKSVLPGHDYSALPLGRFYAADVVPDTEGNHLRVRYYLPKESPLVSQIELGVLKDVSIGFNAGKRLCDLCAKEWDFQHDHFPGQEYDGKQCTLTYCESEAHKAEAMEGSFVWCGAQPGAEAVAMAAKQLGLTFNHNGTSMWDIGRALPAVRGAFEMDLEQAKAEIERLKALPLADAERKQLQEQISALKAKEPLADDGAAYRTHLKAEMKRMATSLDSRTNSDAETKYVDRLLERMPEASAEDLQAFMEPIKQRFDAAFAQGDGHGNGPGDPEDPDKNKKKSSRFGRWAEGW
jgi:hypothetical protein